MEFVDPVTPSWSEYQQQTVPQNGDPRYRPSDKSVDAYNSYLSMYIPNAYQAAMLNYMNEYDKPINQMLRYQQAGLNPYSFQHTSSASGNQGASIKPSTAMQDLSQKKISNLTQGVSSLSSALGVAKELYDYMTYGRERSKNQSLISTFDLQAAGAKARQQEYETAWSKYWNTTGEQDESGQWIVKGSPRATYMELSTNRISAQIAQLSYMVNFLYPSQVDQNKARQALMEYQKQILEGRNDAVLNISTGNKMADMIMKFLAYLLKDNIGMLGMLL